VYSRSKSTFWASKSSAVSPDCVALDARVDVLGDEDDRPSGLLEAVGAADDAVVGGVAREQGAAALVVVEDDPDGAAGLLDPHPLGEIADVAQAVEVPDGGAGVAAEVVGVGLELVQLLDDVERDDDLVVLEHEQRVRVVQQHVRVDDEGLGVAVGFAHWVRRGKSAVSSVCGEPVARRTAFSTV
jgi:hypothetical protein